MKSHTRFNSSRVAMLALFFVLCLTPAIRSQSVVEVYKKANALYRQNQFEQAITLYEKIIVQGHTTTEVYYNLGNCFYKRNNTGKAILYYERAQKLSPDDEDIIHNLKLAQLKTVDKLTPVPQLAITATWNKFVSLNSSSGWGVMALCLVWLAFFVFAAYLFVAQKKFILAFGVLLLLLSVVSGSLAFSQRSSEQNSHDAILLASNATVKSAPDSQATDLFNIHEGIKLQVMDEMGEWQKVRLADGKTGWIEKKTLEKI